MPRPAGPLAGSIIDKNGYENEWEATAPPFFSEQLRLGREIKIFCLLSYLPLLYLYFHEKDVVTQRCQIESQSIFERLSYQANSHSTRGRQRLLSDSLPSAQLSPVVLKPSALTLMSHTHSAAASFSNFQLIINNALDTYRKRTKMDPLTHPLATQFEACDTPAAMLDILQKQVQGPNQSQRGNERWSKWLDSTVNVLFTFSATIGAGVGLACLRTCNHPSSAFSLI